MGFDQFFQTRLALGLNDVVFKQDHEGFIADEALCAAGDDEYILDLWQTLGDVRAGDNRQDFFRLCLGRWDETGAETRRWNDGFSYFHDGLFLYIIIIIIIDRP